MSKIKLLSRAAAANALGICTKSVDNMIRTKQIKALKIGRRVLIPEEHLLKSLAKFNWEIEE